MQEVETPPGRGTGIAVMAKAPRPGQTKTRLLPVLSQGEAAELSAAFLRDVTENLAVAARSGGIVPYVAFAPAGAEPSFANIVAKGTRMLLADGSILAPPSLEAGGVESGVEGFGRCLLHAIESMFALEHAGACVLNADSPNLPTSRLLQAGAILAAPGDRAVIGPAEDGGYYLLGMKRPHAHLFAGIEWSTDRVAAQTRERAAEAGLELVELDPWYDVDEPATLIRLVTELGGAGLAGAYAAPYTAGCLARFRLFPESHRQEGGEARHRIPIDTKQAGATA